MASTTTGIAPRQAKIAARGRVNYLVKIGELADPNDLDCLDCGHVWTPEERRHDYDHHLGYEEEHWEDVEPVCTTCHSSREIARLSPEQLAKWRENKIQASWLYAAQRIGISLAEYVECRELGLRWCCGCRAWLPGDADTFRRDTSRGDGLSRSCRSCLSAKDRSQRARSKR